MIRDHDELLDARIRDLLATRAGEVERLAIDEDAMTSRLVPALTGRPGVFARADVRNALRLLLVAALMAALLGAIAILSAPHRRVLGNGPIAWASATGIVSVADAGGGSSTLGAGPMVEPGTRCCSLAWSPDGSRLAAVSDTELVVLDAQGHRSLPAPGLDVRGAPVWSPDGTRLAVPAIDHNATHVFVIDLAGGAPPMRIDGTLAVSAAPAWSPDGRSVAFGGARTETSAQQQGAPGMDVWGLYVASVDGSGSPHLIAGGLPAGWTNLAQVLMAQAPDWGTSWSPDGTRIAFQAKTADCCGYRIYLVDAAGGRATPVTPASVIATNPQWSPDGGRLAYAAWAPRLSTPVDLAVVAVAAGAVGDPVVLAHDVDPWDIAWSPDGTWIAYGHGESGQILTPAQSFRDIWMVRPDGSGPTQVAVGPFEGGLAWQPVAR